MAIDIYKIIADADDANWLSSGGGLASMAVYSLGLYGSGDSGYLRFQNVAILQGSTDFTAELHFFAYETATTAGSKVKFYGYDVDNAVAPTSGPDARALTPFTTAYTAWNLAALWTQYVEYTVDVTDIVKEIVGRAGFVSGNAIMLVHHDNTSDAGAYHLACAHDYSSSDHYPQMVINTSPAPVASLLTFTCSDPVASWSPSVLPKYGGGYAQTEERYQPKAFAGADLYTYNHGETGTRILEWAALPAADMATLLTFLGLMHGGVHTFSFTDYDATVYPTCRVLNYENFAYKNLTQTYYEVTLEIEVA